MIRSHNLESIIYKKDEIISVFSKVAEIKISNNLEKYTDDQIPVLAFNTKPRLELISPSPKKTPEVMINDSL